MERTEMSAELQGFIQELRTLNGHRFVRLHNSFWQLMFFNFARGLAFGLGTVIGASLLLSFVGWSLSSIEFMPIIGEWAAQIAREIDVELSK